MSTPLKLVKSNDDVFTLFIISQFIMSTDCSPTNNIKQSIGFNKHSNCFDISIDSLRISFNGEFVCMILLEYSINEYLVELILHNAYSNMHSSQYGLYIHDNN